MKSSRREDNGDRNELFLNNFRMLNEGKDYADAEVIHKGKVTRVHHCILSAQSKFFSKAFSNGMKETESKRVCISDEEDAVDIESMIRFCYGGLYRFTAKEKAQATPLCKHARMYRLGDLFQIPLLCRYAVAEFYHTTKGAEWTQALIDDYCEAVKLVYATTPDSDHGMREAVKDVAADHCRALLGREQFVRLLREDVPGLAADVLAGLSQSSRIQPACGN